jgi:hypothetical protein
MACFFSLWGFTHQALGAFEKIDLIVFPTAVSVTLGISSLCTCALVLRLSRVLNHGSVSSFVNLVLGVLIQQMENCFDQHLHDCGLQFVVLFSICFNF